MFLSYPEPGIFPPISLTYVQFSSVARIAIIKQFQITAGLCPIPCSLDPLPLTRFQPPPPSPRMRVTALSQARLYNLTATSLCLIQPQRQTQHNAPKHRYPTTIPRPVTAQNETICTINWKGVWGWCVTFRMTGFVDIVHHRELWITGQRNVSKTEPVSLFRWGDGDTEPLGCVGSSDGSQFFLRSGAPSPEDPNRTSFRNFVFSTCLEFPMKVKVQSHWFWVYD